MREFFLNTIQHRFGHDPLWILVIGDLMLDRYLFGDVQRISPEAPVPVVLLKSQDERAGGAANVAANLAGLGIKTRIAGVIGQDNEAQALLGLMRDIGADTQHVHRSTLRPTITKTRILGGHQQMMRLDQEDASVFAAEEQLALQAAISTALTDGPAAVILSDYAKGVLSETLCQSVIAQATAANIPVLVDPKGRDYSKYQGASGLTPNKRETAEACHVAIHDDQALLAAAEQLRSALQLEFLAVTRGEEGITVLDRQGSAHLAATARQVYDVSGAGDTVIATLTAGLAHGLPLHDAIELANIAAGIVVGKVGTVPINKAELEHELQSQQSAAQADKVCNLDSLLARVKTWRNHGERIVFTNGCFDLLHAGHVTYLEAARHTGDRLVLGLNTDRSVSALKGPTRPVIHEQDRARVLAALESVDAVILFDEDTPIDLIKAIRPDVIVKGSDYTEDQVVGGAEVKSWGGKVALIDVVPGRSTSNIIRKLAS
ncbi:bifunctional D-glycero-beta-D-manno-heptose-7-phosphate kinase/D-glycero-beta-D-manno-heptose 1-phosphate adenylyltransferase HldE [Methylobacillus flagellatus]|uniref:bifunctional D-glycero-beta-D-manno-heptose-7-phosphate kinase/D-glycero-beta-D-manno-heptose 1-phosphate adenylyltransferase HldE n=1 Tax=Methylobacillus flagellatus TaxID=405 RepID=UPI0028540FCF|nr:bifunctional D-glycero-beta-D-manno-heptose-7-phosphate kinase/D-glycero-beta-D-manno-heptose 1-phosphate adenylyltransferase HldE [Methylobacillus flagellatus]MDR5170856.1 bifunctional D-glycero-beta-D-manno-heptose-7-phosphate kinase/D-glycero-beta-D-manno-heptose 1-phosphate adenylyltransferase HldE [Methylobacillus flagellatus]